MKIIKVTICIGSGCHVKGSRTIISLLQKYISDNKQDVEIELEACFCMNRCTEGVAVKFDEEIVTGITKDSIIRQLEERLKLNSK